MTRFYKPCSEFIPMTDTFIGDNAATVGKALKAAASHRTEDVQAAAMVSVVMIGQGEVERIKKVLFLP